MNSFICPRTKLPLTQKGGLLTSSDTNIWYPVVGGIPNFLAYKALETKNESTELDLLVESAQQTNWLDALKESKKSNPGFLEYVTSSRRLKVAELLPVSKTTDLLEIGPGLGQFSEQFCRTCRFVTLLEVVPQQAHFVKERLQQQKLSNFQISIGGDDCFLPFADYSFDAAFANLVFEWCGNRNPINHELSQRRFLDEIWRTLRPGGHLLLSTKNRFSLSYVLGKTDEHSYDLRFGQALPHRVNQWRLNRRGQPRAQGHLYSFNALSDLCVESGFSISQAFWLTPEMRFPIACIPVNANDVSAFRQTADCNQGAGRIGGKLMPLIPAAFVKHVTPGLTFLLRKG
jgi:SAM-dependent methyltransferase